MGSLKEIYQERLRRFDEELSGEVEKLREIGALRVFEFLAERLNADEEDIFTKVVKRFLGSGIIPQDFKAEEEEVWFRKPAVYLRAIAGGGLEGPIKRIFKEDSRIFVDTEGWDITALYLIIQNGRLLLGVRRLRITETWGSNDVDDLVKYGFWGGKRTEYDLGEVNSDEELLERVFETVVSPAGEPFKEYEISTSQLRR